jgi:hypothetical protein
MRRWIERPNGLIGIDTLADEAQARAWRAISRCCCRRRCCTEAALWCSRPSARPRLDGAADVFGLLPAGTDFDAILQRAMPSLQ